MPAPLPPPDIAHPLVLPDGSRHTGTVFLSAAIIHPRWKVGAYTYASAHAPPEDWAAYLAPYLHPQSEERLILGKFCQIADGAMFITASSNHRRDGFSTYPFAVFTGFGEDRPSLPASGPGNFPDTVIGHDVWIGQGARILPGARIGTGVIVAAGAVVVGRVPDYAVVAGNPARIVRQRFDPATVARLLEIAWWDWTPERIMAAEAAICCGDLAALERA